MCHIENKMRSLVSSMLPGLSDYFKAVSSTNDLLLPRLLLGDEMLAIAFSLQIKELSALSKSKGLAR